MSENEISVTGRFPSLSSTDLAASSRAPNSGGSSGAAAAAVPSASGAVSGPGIVSAPEAVVAAQPQRQPSGEEINRAIAAANANLASSDRQLEFRVDAVTGISIATIRNSQTGVVVQQIPGANIIALARMLAEWSPGKHMLLDLIA